MNTYEITFTGRKVGALGKCSKFTQQRFALDEAQAVQALYDQFEHISNPAIKEIRSPFDWEGLFNRARNEQARCDAVLRHVNGLIHEVAAIKEHAAKENAAWHDDPECAEHWLYHAPADMQYPPAMVLQCVAELVLYYLNETPAGRDLGLELKEREQ